MAARTQSRKYGAFALTNTTNGVSVDRWGSRILHRTKFEARKKADGSIPTEDHYEGAEVRLQGDVTGADTGITSTNLENLMSALANGEDYLTLYSDRRLLCRLQDDFAYDLVDGTQGKVYRWSCTMRSRFPFWESTTLSSDTDNLSGAGPHSVVLAANSATAPTYPKIAVQNTGSAFSDKSLNIMQTATGGHIGVSGLSLAAGQTITFDCLEGQLGDGVSVPVTPYTLEANWFYLVPGATTTLELSHTIGASASLSVVTTWRDAYWTL